MSSLCVCLSFNFFRADPQLPLSLSRPGSRLTWPADVAVRAVGVPGPPTQSGRLCGGGTQQGRLPHAVRLPQTPGTGEPVGASRGRQPWPRSDESGVGLDQQGWAGVRGMLYGGGVGVLTSVAPCMNLITHTKTKHYKIKLKLEEQRFDSCLWTLCSIYSMFQSFPFNFCK